MMYKIKYSQKAINDLKHYSKAENKSIPIKIYTLIKEIAKTPYNGKGKPEQLKHQLSGKWSRRINKEHRIIYKANENNLIVTILSRTCIMHK